MRDPDQADNREFRLYCHFKTQFYAMFGLSPSNADALAAAAACEKLAADLRRSCELSQASGWPLGPFLPLFMFAQLCGLFGFIGLVWCAINS